MLSLSVYNIIHAQLLALIELMFFQILTSQLMYYIGWLAFEPSDHNQTLTFLFVSSVIMSNFY